MLASLHTPVPAPPDTAASTQCRLLLIIQLISASLIVIRLDDLPNSSGVSFSILLFSPTNICESIIRIALSTTINTDCGPKFEGAVVLLFHLLFT